MNTIPPAMNDDEQLKAAWAQLTLVLGFFARIDTKLSVILGLDLSMLAVLSTRLPPFAQLTWVLLVLLAATVIPLALALRYLYEGAFPQTHGGSTSLVYFKQIAAMSESDFLRAVERRTQPDLTRDLYEQVWRNSLILDAKFAALKKAYRALLGACVPWLITLAWLSLPVPKTP